MGRQKDYGGDWHHRAPDYKLVYCGPKRNSKEEAKKHNRNRLGEIFVTDTIDTPEMEAELGNKMRRLKLSARR